MTLRRTAVALVLAAAALTGCSSEQEAYCEALADEQATLTDLADDAAEGGEDVLTPTLESYERLRDAAPDELLDEWDTVLGAFESLEDAVQRAGVDPGDYSSEDPPPGLSRAERERLASVASKLASFQVTEATRGIEQHADEVCEVAFDG